MSPARRHCHVSSARLRCHVSAVTVTRQPPTPAAHRAILPGNMTGIPSTVPGIYQIFPTLLQPARSSAVPKIQNKIYVSQGNYAHAIMWPACIPL